MAVDHYETHNLGKKATEKKISLKNIARIFQVSQNGMCRELENRWEDEFLAYNSEEYDRLLDFDV